MANILALTVADHLAPFLNPTADSNLVQFGSSPGQYPTADAQLRLDTSVDIVLARIPERYRPLLTSMVGEVLAYAHDPARTFYNLTLGEPVSGSLILYQDPPADYTMRDEDHIIPTSRYTVSGATITWTTQPPAGALLVADYRHNAAADPAHFLFLREIATNLAACMILRRLPSFSGFGNDRADSLERQAYGDLDRLKRGDCGIPTLDAIPRPPSLSTRNPYRSAEFRPIGGLI